MTQSRLGSSLLSLLLATACAADDKTYVGRAAVPRSTSPATAGIATPIAGSDSAPPLARAGAPASTNSALDRDALKLRIENLQGLTLEIVTLRCAGDCAEVSAIASGGNAPYTYVWQDGMTAATRRVCADTTTQIEVRATDTAIVDAEFGYKAQAATTSLRAAVLGCAADSGTPPPPAREFCVKNPSLEGVPGQATAPNEWQLCKYSPDVNPDLFASIPASDGATYLGAHALSDGPRVRGFDPEWGGESASTAFCAPLDTGQSVSFSVDLTAIASFDDGSLPRALELWGGSSACSRDQLLWTSPPISNIDTWKTYCGTLMPSRAAWSHLTLMTVFANPNPPPETQLYLAIDNFRPKASCP